MVEQGSPPLHPHPPVHQQNHAVVKQRGAGSSPNRITSKVQPELNMWNNVSVLNEYLALCSTFEIHIHSSSNLTQLLRIGTYRGERHHTMLNMAKSYN